MTRPSPQLATWRMLAIRATLGTAPSKRPLEPRCADSGSREVRGVQWLAAKGIAGGGHGVVSIGAVVMFASRGSPHIGELNEGSLHRALKARYATPGSATEQVVEGFVADVVSGRRIIEVETASFGNLKRKLPRLLERFRVTLVHPIARDRYIVKLPDGADMPAIRRRSPRHDSVFRVFNALVSIPKLLEHPNLTLDILMVAVEDIRVAARRRRRGRWTTVDQRLLEVRETVRVRRMADLFAPLDRHLPDRFTTCQLAVAMDSPRRLAQQAAYCFRQTGVAEACGKDGNAWIYRRGNLTG